MERAVDADQDPPLLHPLGDLRGFPGRGFERGPVAHQLHAQVEPAPADVPDERVHFPEAFQPFLHPPADAERVLLEALVAQDVEDGQADRAGDRIAAVRVEILHSVGERCGDLGGRDHRAERVAVADRLSQRHDVGHDALGLESPDVRPDPAESHLHLVGHADPARQPDVRVGLAEISFGQLDLAGAARKGFAVERGDLPALAPGVLDGFGHVAGVLLRGVGIVPAVAAAVEVGEGDRVDVVRRPGAAGPVELVGAEVDQRAQVSVIRGLHDDDVRGARIGPGHPQRQVVGLAAAVHEETDTERLREEAREPVRVPDEVLMEIARVGIEDRGLLLRRPDHAGMAVAHVRDVVRRVQVDPARVVIEVLLPSPDDVKRFIVGEAQRRPQRPAADLEDFFGAHAS